MFYRLDSTRVTLREYLRETRNPIALLIASILKLVRVRLPCSIDDPCVDSLAPHQCSAEDFPADVGDRLAPSLLQLARAGFTPAVYHAIDDRQHKTRLYLAHLRHRSGLVVCRLTVRRWRHPQPPRDSFVYSLISERQRTFVITTSARLDLTHPPSFTVEHRLAASLVQLMELHRQRLLEPGPPVTRIDDEPAMLGLCDRQQAAFVRFQLRRGVFRPLTAPDGQPQVPSVDPSRVSDVAGDATGEADSELVADLTNLRTKRPGWGNAIVMLVVSLVLFLALGTWRWTWRSTAMILPILLFHELGHLAAMRLFRYRNLRMFFIPLFGAAVVGRLDDVAGWKKVIVSLAGPVPGIIVGGLLAITGGHHPFITEASLMMLVINGLNLLPILPLDGGWIAHVLLFSRHRFADVAFRLIAIAALYAAGASTGDRILIYIAIPMLVSLPMAYRTARIADELRREGHTTRPAAGEVVPVRAAIAAANKLRKAMPKGLNARTLVQLTDQILEAAGTHPPGWLATFALGTTHAVFICAAAGALAASVFLRFEGGSPPKPLSLTCSSLEVPRSAPPVATGTSLVTATFPSVAAAGQALVALTPRLASETAQAVPATVFGQTVLVRLDRSDPKQLTRWFDGVFQGSPAVRIYPDQHTALRLVCERDSAQGAESVARDLHTYLDLPFAVHLTPPWAPDRTLSDEALRARRTYIEVNRSVDEDPELEKLDSDLATAAMTDDESATVERLRSEAATLRRKLELEQLAGLRSADSDRLDPRILDRFEERLALDQNDATELGNRSEGEDQDDEIDDSGDLIDQWWLRTTGQLMGLAAPPSTGADAAPAMDPYGAMPGFVSTNDRSVSIFVSLPRLEAGGPALAGWLCQRGCSLSYSLSGGATTAVSLESMSNANLAADQQE